MVVLAGDGNGKEILLRNVDSVYHNKEADIDSRHRKLYCFMLTIDFPPNRSDTSGRFFYALVPLKHLTDPRCEIKL